MNTADFSPKSTESHVRCVALAHVFPQTANMQKLRASDLILRLPKAVPKYSFEPYLKHILPQCQFSSLKPQPETNPMTKNTPNYPDPKVALDKH